MEEAPVEVAGAVNEHVAAARLGVSLDVLRRDRGTGKLGIPFFKLGEGKRGLVRYDLADLDRWVETKKRVGQVPQAQRLDPVEEPVARQEIPATVEQVSEAPVAPTKPVQPWTAPEPPEPRRSPSRSRSPWDAMPRSEADDPFDDDVDPFATGDRSSTRRPGGYFSG